MIIKFKKRNISFILNYDHKGIAFYGIEQGIHVKYRLAVFTFYEGDSVTLLNLSTS